MAFLPGVTGEFLAWDDDRNYLANSNPPMFDRRPGEALTAFREAARLDPGSTVNRYAIAGMLADLGEPEQALAALEDAERLARVVNPGDPENDRHAALVLSRVDPERARPLWRRYLAAMERVKNPGLAERARIAEARAVLERIERGRPGAAISR